VLDEEDAAAYDFPGLRLGRDDAWAEQLWREMQQRRSRGSAQPAIGAGEGCFYCSCRIYVSLGSRQCVFHEYGLGAV
jgi:hypothetical protein